MISGPLVPGTWLADNFPAPFRFSLPERGWLSAVGNRSVGLARFDEPSTFLGVMAPQQVFTPAGGVRRLKSVDQLLEVLTSNPNLAILARERVQIGGIPAVQLTLRVLPHKGFPDFCPATCVALFPLPRQTFTLESRLNDRLSSLHRTRRDPRRQ